MKSLKWRSLFIGFLTLLALYGVVPTLLYYAKPKDLRDQPGALPSWVPNQKVKLGLDLQGGIQLVLGVDTAGAIETRLGRMGVDLGRLAPEWKIPLKTAYVDKESKFLAVVLDSQDKKDEFLENLFKEFPILEAKETQEPGTLVFDIKASEKERLEKSALEQAEHVIRSRVDMWGVSEPIIFRRADGSIMVQLPGFRDPEEAKNLLGRTAQLKFKIVDDLFDGFSKVTETLPQGITKTQNEGQVAFSGEDKPALIAFLKTHIPKDRELLFSRETIAGGKKNKWTSLVVHGATEMLGDDVADAFLTQSTDFDRKPQVALRFTPTGSRRFSEVTGNNVNKKMAIVLDDVVEMAPVINQKISGGQASISLGGGRNFQEMEQEGTQIALVLKSGAIPAAIKILEERQVGASLGPELATQGILGFLVGLGLIFIFMIFYYRKPGVIACMALILNAVFLLALMASFGFALTLPGIAGFVLTLGMAVDANVLINERIRQEIREGRHPKKAVELGFSKAFGTILDSNLTTLVAVLVLLETNSSGPIRGFAINLGLGLLVSLFTSVYCTHWLFDAFLSKVADKDLKTWLTSGGFKPRETITDFSKASASSLKVALGIAALIIGFGATQGLNWGVDFAGGTEMEILFAQPVKVDTIRSLGDKAQLSEMTVQAIGTDSKHFLLRYEEKATEQNQTDATVSQTFVLLKNHLMEDLKEFQPQIQTVDFVGPQVGKDLRNQGILSLLYAVFGIFLYVAFRFDMRFAPGALLKMFLDVLLMSGFYVFFRASFDLVAVAALLTVIGYSVNDTIVIYDRIRENILIHPKRSLFDNINYAVNETLGRSINTSITTVISLVGLLVFTTGQIWNFAMAMTIGICVATLSSILIAGSLVLFFERMRSKRLEKLHIG